jgi:hypothetical protein
MVGLRKPIKIIDVSPVKDGNGFMKANEALLFSGWAEVTNPSSSRIFTMGQDVLTGVKFFRIRNHHGISTNVNTRILYDGKRYAVDSIEKEKEKNFYWIIRGTAKDDK